MYAIHHLLTIQAPPDAVFAAITTPQGLNSWWTKESAGQAVLGQDYRFYFGEGYDWQAKVIDVEKNQRISWEMTQADADWEGTILEFVLTTKEENRTILRFSHRNWDTLNDHFKQCSFHWAIYLNDMRHYLQQAESNR
jgi:uncharacterized protein YndB with AHSA1/START domain